MTLTESVKSVGTEAGRHCFVVMVERKGRKVGTGSVGTEGMGVMGGDTHRQYCDGRQCCVVMTERIGRKVGTGSVGTEGMSVMGGDTHRKC